MEQQGLTMKQKVGYAFGAIPAAILLYLFYLYYIEFFYDDLKLMPFLFIIGQGIFATINAVNDPLMGQLSDKTNREKWGGRRIPFIKYGAPIWAITYALTWFPWSYDNQILIFLQFVTFTCAYDTMMTLVILCWMALLPEMTSDIQERNQVNFIVGILGLVGLLPFIILAPIYKSAGLLSFQIFNIVVAIISATCFIIVARVSKERPEFQHEEVFPIGKSLKETLKMKSFRFFVLYNFFVTLNSSIGLSYLFAYVFILGGDFVSAFILYFLIFILVGYSSNFFCIKLAPKFGMWNIT
ncbi:MAG: MFS transporter, partial [Promethearchaeota archaeon]